MNFPKIKEIATKKVIAIKSKSNIHSALEKMMQNNHRNIVVIDNDSLYLLTINDIIRFKLEGQDFNKKLNECFLVKAATIKEDANVLDALEIIQEKNSEYICVVDENNKLSGILSNSDILSSIDPNTLIENYKLNDLINITQNAKRARAEQPLSIIYKDLFESSSDCVIVIDDNDIPQGILTTKDILRIVNTDIDPSLPIKNFMISPVEVIDEETTIKEAIVFMQKKKFKRVVVVDKKSKKLKGVIKQKELISLSFSNWLNLIKNYQSELQELNKILEEKAQKYKTIAAVDALTGLYNRQKLDELFELELYSMKKKGNPLSIAIVDIDFFKKINDTYGHSTGDMVLVGLSNFLLQHLRSTDIVARWGGEEFVLVLNSVDIDNAFKLTDKIRDKLSKKTFDKVGHITISIGITDVTPKDTFFTAFNRADKALYKSKKDGRNRVSMIKSAQ